jgi:hypothetical protein
MKSRTVFTGALLIACCLVAATTAQAGTTVTSLWVPDVAGGTVNQASDDSAEYFLDNNGNGILDAGDALRGVFDITAVGKFGSLTTLGAGFNEFTGVFQTKVVSATFNQGSGKYDYVFGPDATFAEAITEGVPGAMVIFYEDPQNNYAILDNAAPYAGDIGRATDGSYYWAFGFTTALTSTGYTTAGEGWFAETSYNSILNLFESTEIGSASFGMNRIYKGSGAGEAITLGKRVNADFSTPVEMTGNSVFYVGGLNGNGQVNGVNTFDTWPVIDNAEFFVNPLSIAPLPSAAWMGMALLGALGLGRRLRRRG